MLLNKENEVDTNATLLDIEIKIEHGRFVYYLYDKRDNFDFSIVRFPFKSSNMPSKMFYLLSGLKLFVSAKLLQIFQILSDVAVHFTNACWIREQLSMASNLFSKSFTIGTIHIFLNFLWITTNLYLNWNINNKARH